MFFADFETTTSKINSEKSWVWLWGIKGAEDGDRLIWGLDIESFLDTLKEKKMNTIYFHNLSFDGNYIYKWLIDNDFTFRNMMDGEQHDALPKNHWEWICDERGGIYVLNLNYKGYQIKFLDSWKVLMASVENLGESIGLEKLELDYDTIYTRKEDVPKQAIDYLERDIDVVIKTFTKAISLYDKKMTRAAMSYEDFIKFYNDENDNGRQFSIDFGGKIWDYRNKEFVWKNVLTKEEWKFINKSYQGGYTNWNLSYTNKKIETPYGVSYDVNSLYPSVMMNYKIPYGKPLYFKPMSGEYVALKTILIQKAVKKEEHYPAIIKRHSGKYTEAKYHDEVSYEEYTYWEEELEFIKKYYDMHYIEVKTMYFKVKWVFRNWLEEKKELKINATDPIERDFHKGIYNSCYGKFAQNIKMGSRIIIKDGKYVKEIDGVKYLCSEETGEVVRKLASNAIRYGKNGEFKHDSFFSEVDKYKHIAVASYITMKARMILFSAMFNNLDIWIYSDTDSCYFLDEPKGIEIHESKFGAWKPEHRFTQFKVLRAKAYIFQSSYAWKNGGWKKSEKIVKKISGLSKEGKEKVNFENFYIGSIIKGGKRGVKNVSGGKFIYDADFKLGKDDFI